MQGLTQSLPESLQTFHLDLYNTKVICKEALGTKHIRDFVVKTMCINQISCVRVSLQDEVLKLDFDHSGTGIVDDDIVLEAANRCLQATLTDSGVQGLMQSLPESLQKLDLNFQHTRVTASGCRV